jgi:DNA-binding transcriptional LysR family regulator
MGIAMVPRIVLRTFPDVKLLSIHRVAPQFSRAPTVLIRRKGAVSPKVSALIEVLTDRLDGKGGQTQRRKDEGNGAQAFANGRSHA